MYNQNMSVYVRLLGIPSIKLGNEWITPSAAKTSALLYYLAHKNHWVDRNTLAYLFWADVPEENARGNLRNLLSRLKNLSYAQTLEIERGRLRWVADTDLKAFQNALETENTSQTIELYTGELMQGFRLDGAPEFEAWLETERQEIFSVWRETVFQLSSALETEGQHENIANAFEKLHKADPFDEDVLKRYLQSLHLTGRQSKALDTFKQFEQKLKDELGGEPEQTTLDLIKQIKTSAIKIETLTKKKESIRSTLKEGLSQNVLTEGATQSIPDEESTQGTPQKEQSVQKTFVSQKLYNLPTQPTPFVGRIAEQKQLTEQLSKSDCNLITIVAPGGMGKTRFAIAAAKKQLANFKDGIYFVPFAPVTATEQMVYALADGLNFNFYGRDESENQLLDYLKDKNMLLVLDNLEHLLAGVELISKILQASTNIKVLATSRERLNLHAEWLFDLRGLSFPEEDTKEATNFDAIKLFIQSAQKVQPSFTMDEQNTLVVTRICKLIQGMPLATELAAAWLELLSLDEILAEIKQGIDFLETEMRDLPERQRSIKSVFDTSWKRLSESEQLVFMNLSVFRGGFTREAAQSVASANLRTLRSLVNKSLIFLDGKRYGIHELLRQYGEEKLAETPKLVTQLSDVHCQYFTDFLHLKNDDVLGWSQLEASKKIEVEFDNIRAAWQWAIKTANVQAIHKAAMPSLTMFFQFQSRYIEALDFFNQAATMLKEQPHSQEISLALINILQGQAQFSLRTGQLEQVEHTMQESLELYQELGINPIDKAFLSDPRGMLSFAASVRGDYSKAAQYAEKMLIQARDQDNCGNCQFGYYLWARALIAQGQNSEAEKHAKSALDVAEKSGDTWFSAYILNTLAGIAIAQQDFDLARKYCQRSYDIRKQFDDTEGMAVAINLLGDIAMWQDSFENAKELYQQALVLYQDINDQGGLAKAQNRLGDVNLSLGQYEEAKRHLHKALEIVSKHQFSRFTTRILVSAGHYFLLTGNSEKGVELLCFTINNPASDQEVKTKATSLLEQHSIQNTTAYKAEHDLQDITNKLLIELA